MRTKIAARLQTLAGAAILISAVTLLSRILGFARSIAQATWVGTGGVAEPYAIANQLPNVLFEVAAGGALAGAVIPLLAGALVQGDKETLDKISSALMTWVLAILVPLALLVCVFASPIVGLLTEFPDQELHDTATFFLRIFSVQIPLYGVGILFGGMLQAYKRFLWPALAPLFSSLTVIIAYFVFGLLADGHQSDVSELTIQALRVLAWGTTAGVAAMALTMVGPVRQLNLRLRPTFKFPDSLGRKAATLAFAGIGALAAQQLAMVVVMRMSSVAGTRETFNLFQYSQSVYVLPYAVLVVPIATSAFPRIADLAARKLSLDLNALVSGSTRTVIALAGLSAALLIAASGSLEAFFATFTRGSVDHLGAAIAWAAPGLLGFALILQLSRVLYATDNGRSAVAYTALGWLVAAVLSVALPLVVARPEWTVVLFAGAQAVGMAVAGSGLCFAVRRRLGAGAVAGWLRSVFSTSTAAGLAAAAGYWLAGVVLPGAASLATSVLVGALVGVLTLFAFVALLYLLDRSTASSFVALGRKDSTDIQPHISQQDAKD